MPCLAVPQPRCFSEQENPLCFRQLDTEPYTRHLETERKDKMCVQRLRTCTCDICNFVVVLLASVVWVRSTNIAGHEVNRGLLVTLKQCRFWTECTCSCKKLKQKFNKKKYVLMCVEEISEHSFSVLKLYIKTKTFHIHMIKQKNASIVWCFTLHCHVADQKRFSCWGFLPTDCQTFCTILNVPFWMFVS